MNRLNYLLMALALGTATLPVMAEEHLHSLDLNNVDKSVNPKENFFDYVTNGWRKSHPLTPEYARYGQFNILNDSSNNRVQRIVTGLSATNPAPGTNAYKVAAIYEMAMDSVRRNQLGAEPIKPMLRRIENTGKEGMTDLFYEIQKHYGSPFMGVGIQEDLNNSAQYAMYIGSGGMGLGDRDYYLKNDKENKKIREAYKKMMHRMLVLSGYSKKDANRIVKNVMKIETALADSALTREESRNMLAMNNPRTMDWVKANYPNIPWDNFYKATMGLDNITDVIVTEPRSMAAANNLMKSTTDREKKDYYIWQVVKDGASCLSDDFTNAAFEFSKVMSGVEKQQPRWKRALAVTEGSMGEAIGELYVEEYFPASSKEYMEGLVENIRTSLGKHILNLPWMSDETKLRAINKLGAITVKIGYPDKWKDYSGIDIDPTRSYLDNVLAAANWYAKDNYSKLGKPVDKTEWLMTPQTVNAYYMPTTNEICFPAAILQAPYFDVTADDAINYGAIGVVIGHEMTHGFDDSGRQFDKNGNLNDWWTADDAARFTKLADGLAAQFDAIEVAPGVHANGRFTLGENIADQGGLRVAMTAYKNSQKGKKAKKIDGFTPEQRFYLGYANLWAGNIRDEEILVRTKTDPHSLGRNRVNASLRNIAPFFDAFKIKAGDPMFRPEEERIIIW